MKLCTDDIGEIQAASLSGELWADEGQARPGEFASEGPEAMAVDIPPTTKRESAVKDSEAKEVDVLAKAPREPAADRSRRDHISGNRLGREDSESEARPGAKMKLWERHERPAESKGRLDEEDHQTPGSVRRYYAVSIPLQSGCGPEAR